MTELHLGIDMGAGMTSLFRERMNDRSLRETLLEARRWTGPDAVQAGFIDNVGGWPEVVKLINDKKLAGLGKTGVYGLLRDEIYRESVALQETHVHANRRDWLESLGRPRWSKL